MQSRGYEFPGAPRAAVDKHGGKWNTPGRPQRTLGISAYPTNLRIRQIRRERQVFAALIAFVTRGRTSSPREVAYDRFTTREIRRKGSFDAIVWLYSVENVVRPPMLTKSSR